MRPPLTAPGEQGSATAEFLLTITAVLAGILVAVQAALTHLAGRALLAAADEGARAARAEHATAVEGRHRALDYLAQIAPGLLRDPAATSSRTTSDATVTVHATMIAVLPGFEIRLTARATSPVEAPR